MAETRVRSWLIPVLAFVGACGGPFQETGVETFEIADGRGDARATAAKASMPLENARNEMVSTQLEARGIRDEAVLRAMRRVPRHEFVPARWQASAYQDRPLPIGHRQTISQPYVVAAMSESAQLGPGSRVLEVGTGSGYQAAVLREMGALVYTIEIIEPLAQQAAVTLQRLGYDGIEVRHGDGYRGWPEAAPFDAVIVTAAAPEVPRPLLEQLAPGGRLVIPVGSWEQHLEVHTRTPTGFERKTIFPVRFVPMTGEVDEADR